ncbi:hypothetical protein HHK36_010602 [Tetracentron sinense]|uniref:Haloacid dehalogenase-like hydrolase superfamily protein n=1 Tax=Tetracentron sinense TaxID=13715 RepID=A0A834ZH55_TETSI|nr:hypothetical protein HHK36_010602 [Tetracentron sinense]
MDCNFRSSSLFLPRPTSLLQISRLPIKLRLPRLKRPSIGKHFMIRSSFGIEENGSGNGFPTTPNKIFMEEAIGAEYGEGFETFRPDGLLKVDVDFLNDRLQDGFLQRIRYAMKPDEAFGLIFSLDNVVVNILDFGHVTYIKQHVPNHNVDVTMARYMHLPRSVVPCHGVLCSGVGKAKFKKTEVPRIQSYDNCFLSPLLESIPAPIFILVKLAFVKVQVNTRALKLNTWKQLAFEEGKEIPEDDDAQRQMLYAGIDHVLHKVQNSFSFFESGKHGFCEELIDLKVFLWEKAETELDRLKSRLSQLYYENLLKLTKPMKGLEEWLDAVSTARIPCAVVSCLDRRNLVEALERMGLKKYFQAIVTEEDGMESIAHRFLSAAVKLDRKPSKCVVFEDDPRSITAAHNCTMMAVALIGAHPAYELVQADIAVASFSELSVINLRRLFAHKGSTFMELQKQIIEKAPPKRKLTIDTIF